MVRVGVTGATGFIGGGLVPRLARAGYSLTLVDNHSGPLRIQPAGRTVLEESFSGEDGLAALSECDALLHLGAASGVVMCANDPVGTARTNVEGTRQVVEMAAARRIPVVFASSFAVVGSPEHLPVTEQTPARPTHEYARQKAEGERIVRTLAERGAASAVILRMSNVYGRYVSEGQPIEKGNVITLFAQQAPHGHLRVNAPGTQRRNFIHIEDVFAHWLAALEYVRRPASPRASLFNCAGDEAYSVLEVADKVTRAWAEAHPGAARLQADVVPNPRAAIELIDPEFSVSREWTERELGVHCEHTVDETLRDLFAGSAVS